MVPLHILSYGGGYGGSGGGEGGGGGGEGLVVVLGTPSTVVPSTS